MYKIISTKSGGEVAIVDDVTYIKVGASGDYTPARPEEATGVAVNGTAYDLIGRESIGGADTVIVSHFDGGALVAEQRRTIAELENALCEMDAAADERMTAVEDALCDLDSLFNDQ